MELLAMQMVINAEKKLGNEPREGSGEKRGCGIESKFKAGSKLRFIEVKARAAGTIAVRVTRNEILTALNRPDEFILAVALIDGDQRQLRCIRRTFQHEPDVAVESVSHKLDEILARGEAPA